MTIVSVESDTSLRMPPARIRSTNWIMSSTSRQSRGSLAEPKHCWPTTGGVVADPMSVTSAGCHTAAAARIAATPCVAVSRQNEDHRCQRKPRSCLTHWGFPCLLAPLAPIAPASPRNSAAPWCHRGELNASVVWTTRVSRPWRGSDAQTRYSTLHSGCRTDGSARRGLDGVGVCPDLFQRISPRSRSDCNASLRIAWPSTSLRRSFT